MRQSVTHAIPIALFFAVGAGHPGQSHAQSQPLQLHDLQPRVVGGQETSACAWPTTVGVGTCTGTLIHPRVVIYAAHCGDHDGAIHVGPDIQDPVKRYPVQHCETYPGGGILENDFAYCLLEEPVKDLPIIPPLMGSDTLLLRKGVMTWAVGYGYSDVKTLDYGIKHEVQIPIVDLSQGVVIAGANGKDACQGDSGGPLFIELPNQRGFRVFGITSFGLPDPSGNLGQIACGFGGGWAQMHLAMPWFEQQTGLDLTPCHDAQGNPDPDERCGIAPLAPHKATGSWDRGCNFGPMSPANDNLPPSIQWLRPQARELGGAGQTLEIELTASDDHALASVQLFINGEPQALLERAPFRWSITIPEGDTLVLDAEAVDDQGWSTRAPTREFQRQTAPPPQTRDPGDTRPDAHQEPQDPRPTDDPQERGGCRVQTQGKLAASFALAIWGLALGRRRGGISSPRRPKTP